MPIRIRPFDSILDGPPDVSIVIPTFNRLSMLQEALASVYAQSYEGIVEILVVNDNPREDLPPVIRREFPETALISPGAKLGMCGARNRAIARARGRYVAFLDDDDLWEPDYLKAQLSAVDGNDASFAVSGVVLWDTRRGLKRSATQEPDLVRYRSAAHHLMVKNFIRCPSSVVVPREAFQKTGFFDEASPMGSDYALYLRLMVAGFCPVFTRRPLVVKRKHGERRMTAPENQDERNAARLARVEHFYPLIAKRFPVAPLRVVTAEVHAKFAARYFHQRRFLRGLSSLFASLAFFSPRYSFRRLFREPTEETFS